MARYYFPGDNLIVAAGGGSPAALTVNPAAEFRCFSAETSGSEYTDLLAEDGVTAIPLNTNSRPYADSNGKPPGLWGPDGIKTMWRDTGSGRYPMYPSTEMGLLLVNGARVNVANTFTAAQTFSGAVSHATAPTVAGAAVVTTATHGDSWTSQFAAYGQYFTLFYNGTTWPALSTVPAAYIALTRPIIWDSQTYLAAAEPSEARNGDYWDKRIS